MSPNQSAPGISELRRAAHAKQRLLGNLKRLEDLTTTAAVPALLTTITVRKVVQATPILTAVAACAAGYLAGRRPPRPRSYRHQEAQEPPTMSFTQRNPIWAGLAGAGLQLIVDRLTGWAQADRFSPHE